MVTDAPDYEDGVVPNKLKVWYVYQNTELNISSVALASDIHIVGVSINASIVAGNLSACVGDTHNQTFAQMCRTGEIVVMFPAGTDYLLVAGEILWVSALSLNDKSWSKIYYYGDATLETDE